MSFSYGACHSIGVPKDSLMIEGDKMGVAGSFCAPPDNGLANSKVNSKVNQTSGGLKQ